MQQHERQRTIISALSLAALLYASPTLLAAPAYSVTNLTPVLPPAGVNAFNSTGEFVTGNPNPPYMPFLDNNGTFGDLPTFGGPATVPNSINDSGQITGYSTLTNDFNPPQHAFLYSNGTMTDIGTLGGTQSAGTAINANGDVAGWSATNTGSDIQAFLYSHGQMIDIGDLGGGYSYANGINIHDQIVGMSRPATSGAFAFLYSNGVMTNLGTLGGTFYSNAVAINDAGQIVGGAQTAGDVTTHAFLYSNGTMTDLTPDAVGSFAWDINNAGTVVGEFDFPDPVIPNQNDTHAFLYSNGTLTDLNTLVDPASGYLLEQAVHTNANGQILVWGLDPSGQPAQLLLTPTPEPATFTLLTLSIPLLLKRRPRPDVICGFHPKQ